MKNNYKIFEDVDCVGFDDALVKMVGDLDYFMRDMVDETEKYMDYQDKNDSLLSMYKEQNIERLIEIYIENMFQHIGIDVIWDFKANVEYFGDVEDYEKDD